MHVHTGEKPFKCNICVSQYARSYSLRIHLCTHPGENLTNMKFVVYSLETLVV